MLINEIFFFFFYVYRDVELIGEDEKNYFVIKFMDIFNIIDRFLMIYLLRHDFFGH